MASPSRALRRAALLVGLALWLQGSTCRASFCSDDNCHDEEEHDDTRTETVVVLPLPVGGPVPMVFRLPRERWYRPDPGPALDEPVKGGRGSAPTPPKAGRSLAVMAPNRVATIRRRGVR
jgi:hypothetical protein